MVVTASSGARRLGGLPPDDELDLIDKLIIPMRERQWLLWSMEILPELAEHRIVLVKNEELKMEEREALRNWFVKSVLPILTPLMVDPTHPFPFIRCARAHFIVSFFAHMRW